MTITTRIEKSIQFVAEGITRALHNPALFMYPLIFLSVPAIIVIAGSFDIPPLHDPIYTYTLLASLKTDPSALITITLITIFYILLIFMAASIAIHTFAILNHKSITISKTLRKLLAHAKHLAWWGVITTVLIHAGLAALYMLHAYLHSSWSSNVLRAAHFAADLGWVFTTFFMLHIDSLENRSLLVSFRQSFHLTFKLIPHVIALKMGYALTLYVVLRIGLLNGMALLDHIIILQDPYRTLFIGVIASMLILFLFTIYVVLTTSLYKLHIKEIVK
jgi:hypothetical protein